MRRKILVGLIAIIIMICIVPINSWQSSASTIRSGTYGEISWNLTAEGALTIKGTGALDNGQRWNYDEYPWYPYKSMIKTVIIGEGITEVNSEAFSECYNLSDVTLPSTINYIYSGAFQLDEKLSKITIPSSTRYIGSYAFQRTGLKSISIPDSVESIGEGAFENCYKLESVNIKSSMVTDRLIEKSFGYTPWYIKQNGGVSGSTGDCIWQIDENLVLYILGPNEIKAEYLGDNDYIRCAKTAVVSDKVKSMKQDAFSGCDNLTKISVPSTLKIYEYGSRTTNKFYIGWDDATDKGVYITTIKYQNYTGPSFEMAIAEGTYGEISWNLTAEGTLTIKGTGALDNGQRWKFEKE